MSTHSAKGTAETLIERVALLICSTYDGDGSTVDEDDLIAARAAMLALADAIDDAAPIEDTATWLRAEVDRG